MGQGDPGGGDQAGVNLEFGDRPASAEARRNAVWTLARIDGGAARAAVRAALGDADASVVHVAMQEELPLGQFPSHRSPGLKEEVAW